MNLDIAGSRPTLGLHPTFKDLDNDNDLDMILGDYNGFIHYFTNIAGSGNTAAFTLTHPEYLHIDVGNNATPLLYDLDNDGLYDLIIGKKIGTFSYYKNTGTSTTPNFSLITDSLGKVTTRLNFNGNSNPFIIDSSGTTQLFSGSNNGSIYKFGNIDENLTGTFSVDSSVQQIWEGINSTVALYDINNDNLLDMLIGNQSGGLTYYDGDTIPPEPITPTGDTEVIQEDEIINEVNIYPNPTLNSITIDIQNNEIKYASIEVMNLLGKKLVKQKISTQKTNINLSNYRKGIYLIKFSNRTESKVYKIIKK